MEEPQRPRIQQRAFFRLRYPTVERPRVQIGDQEFEVSEISEEGAKIVLAGPCVIDQEQPFVGILRFHDDQADSIEGVVLRSSEDELVASLTRGVSMKRMMSEQIRLRQKFPPAAETPENGSGEAVE